MSDAASLVKFFDCAALSIPGAARKEQSAAGIQKKYASFKSGGYVAPKHKSRKASDEDASTSKVDSTPKFIMPANFGTRDELMARLKAKVAEVNAKAPADDVKKRKREQAAEEEKKKKKIRKQKQKAQEKEYKATKKAVPVVADDTVVSLKDTTVLAPGQLPASEAGAIKTDPTKIQSDFKFATVTQSVATKEYAKAGMVSHKKGHKQQQLRDLEKFNERVQKVKESGDDVTAERMLMNKHVKGAMARAAGEVLKDDERLLKKSLKRKERSKTKSQKVWKEKVQQQESKSKEHRDAKNIRIKKKVDEKVAKSKGTFVKAKKSKLAKSTKDSNKQKSQKTRK